MGRVKSHVSFYGSIILTEVNSSFLHYFVLAYRAACNRFCNPFGLLTVNLAFWVALVQPFHHCWQQNQSGVDSRVFTNAFTGNTLIHPVSVWKKCNISLLAFIWDQVCSISQQRWDCHHVPVSFVFCLDSTPTNPYLLISSLLSPVHLPVLLGVDWARLSCCLYKLLCY